MGGQNDREEGCHSEARFPLSVILRSFAPKNLWGHAPQTGGKILRFAQNDKGAVIRRRGSPSSVILRSFAPKNLSGHAPETGEKILRFAQNDNGGTE